MRLTKVLVFVKDLARMRAFYEGVLGLAVVEEREDNVRLDAGGALILLHAIPAQHAAGIQISDPPKPRSETPLKLIFEVDDVAATRAKLLDAGAQTRDLVQHDDGHASCDCLDLEGNVFRIENVR